MAGSVECTLCPRRCVLANYQRGDCRVRVNVEGRLKTLVFGKACTSHVDPVEKKPLYHFLSGTAIYSLATAGCNLHCKYCQNWEISQVDPEDTRNADLPPEMITAEALAAGCRSVAYTYSEPTIFIEYVLASARHARQHGLRTVLVTAGYINDEPLREVCRWTDAANVDLKALSDSFYRNVCGGRLAPVLRALTTYKEMGVWLEVTNLIVPGLNDTEADVTRLVRWHHNNLGVDTPLHFSRFFPMYKLANLPPTPEATLVMARDLARAEGLRYVYVGNLPEGGANGTYCPRCNAALVERKGFDVVAYRLEDGKCPACGMPIPGIWE